MDSFIEDLRIEYAIQDNRATAYPIFVTVQELHQVGVIEENHSVFDPYGDGFTKTVYRHPDFENYFDTEEELIKEMQQYYEDDDKVNSAIPEIEIYSLGYIWRDVEWFLTIKGAEEYIKANGHNLTKPRTYVHHFSRRNFEMTKFLDMLDFCSEDELRKRQGLTPSNHKE